MVPRFRSRPAGAGMPRALAMADGQGSWPGLLALQIVLLDVILATLVQLDAPRIPPLGLVQRRAIHGLEEIDDRGVSVHHHGITRQAVTLPADLPQDLVSDGRLRLNLPGAVAVETRLVQHAPEALPRPLARHLDQAELADAVERGLRLVLDQSRLQRPPDLLAVAVLLHVDEVEDHQAADVPEAQLVGDLLHGLEVRLERRLLQVLAALADVTAGVHVDRRERFGLIDDQRPAARQRHLAAQGAPDLVLDAVGVEDRLAAG